ncbi:MAG: TetR/AcrR family transcriptional regulator [Elusimicrobia bacterium]|nr:TetR/AcrR family transcriptional regulator [Elusimicrobiota bacterium]
MNDQVTEVQAKILAAAKSEFARHGLKGARVRGIAAKAGVTAAMINYYYRSKKALHAAVVDEAMNRLAERLGNIWFAERLMEQNTDLMAGRLAGAYFDFLCEEQQLQQLLMREILDQGQAVSGFVHRYVTPMRSLWRSRLPPERADLLEQAGISIFGAIAGYFLYSPMLGDLLGKEPLSPETLSMRRRHIVDLASRVVSSASNS